MAEKTYTGPNPEDEFFGGKKLSLEIFIGAAAMVVAVLAMIVGIVVWSRTTSLGESIAQTNDNVAKESASNLSFYKDATKTFDRFQVRLAEDATRLTVLETKVKVLAAKSVVEQLAEEMKNKASTASVRNLSSDILMMADKKSVDRIARRVGGMHKRINNLVELNKLVEIAPAAPAATPEVRRQATLPASQAIPAEQARIDAERAVPAGRPEAPAGKIPPPAK